MAANFLTTILPGLLCAWELLTVWHASHSLADVLADVPALDGTLTLTIMF